jgi:hypothetical protein
MLPENNQLMGAHGNSWELMGAHGSSWELMGACNIYKAASLKCVVKGNLDIGSK